MTKCDTQAKFKDHYHLIPKDTVVLLLEKYNNGLSKVFNGKVFLVLSISLKDI
jgi:hypothetical protein